MARISTAANGTMGKIATKPVAVYHICAAVGHDVAHGPDTPPFALLPIRRKA
jgi:hypothetical protein